MITTTINYIRTDLTIPWHLDSPYRQAIYPLEFRDHVEFKYSNKKIDHTYKLSDDGLTLMFRSYWQSLSDYQEYINDPICIDMIARRNAHNTRFGIISESSIIE